VPPRDLAAELFAPVNIPLPALAAGQVVNMTLPLGGIEQYTFSSTNGGYAKHNGWCALYNGGTGSVTGKMTCRTSDGKEVYCGGTDRTVQLPKDRTARSDGCNFNVVSRAGIEPVLRGAHVRGFATAHGDKP
jgi:hypothetical protein